MNRNYNSVAFTPEEVKKGLHTNLIYYLLSFNSESESDEYYEIHITSDGYCTIVEFEKIPYDHSFGGTFEYVDSDHRVMKEYIFPDNSIQYLGSDEEFNEVLEDWLKDNPGWVKGPYGGWYHDSELLHINDICKVSVPTDTSNEEEQDHALDFGD